MIIQHFVLLLLILWQPAFARPSCDRIYIQGLDPDEFPFAHNYEGIYRRLYPDDPPAYAHETKDIVLQFESPSYMVFTPMGSADETRGILYVEFAEDYKGDMEQLDLAAINPFQLVIKRWLFRDPITNEFFPLSSNVRFHCAPKHMHQCSANIFHFSGNVVRKAHGQLQYAVQSMDDFVAMDTIHNLRPVYYSVSKDLYLFFDGLTHWMVSRDVGGNPIMRVKHKAYHPEYITKHWEVLFERRTSVVWKQDRDIRLECATSIGDLYASKVPCSDFNPCQNQGTCYEPRFGHERYCLCREGYYGIICESFWNTCDSDDTYIAPGVPKVLYHGSPYNQHTGSIAMNPCPTADGVEYSPTVCIKERDVTFWHSTRGCDISQETSDGPNIASKYPSMELPRQLDESLPEDMKVERLSGSFHGQSITIIVAVFIVIIQLLIPALVYPILRLRHKQLMNQRTTQINKQVVELQGLEEKRDSVMREISIKYPGAIYSTEEGNFLFVKDGLYTEEQKHEIAMEYHRADCELRAELDDVSETHSEELAIYNSLHQISLKRYMSACCFFSLWIWLIIFTIQVGLKSYNWNQTEAVFTSVGFGVCIFSYFFMIVESFTSHERHHLSKLSKHGNAEDYLSSLKESQPVLLMSVACHHFGLRSNSVFGNQENGSFKPITTTTPEKVVTHTEEKVFEYSMWVDNSQDFVAPEQRSVLKMRIAKKINFADAFSKQCFNRQLLALRTEYEKKDQFVQFSVQAHIDNFEEEVVLNYNAPAFVTSKFVFWLFAFLGLTWVYRMIARTYITHKTFRLSKTIYCCPVAGDGLTLCKFDAAKAHSTKGQFKEISYKVSEKKQPEGYDRIFKLRIDDAQNNINLPNASVV